MTNNITDKYVERITYKFSIQKMSVNYFIVLNKIIEDYSKHLLTQVGEDKLAQELKDYSILLEIYFLLEPKISNQQRFKPEEELNRHNKAFKLKMHQGLVLLEALYYYQPRKEFYETPAIEHIKDQLAQNLL